MIEPRCSTRFGRRQALAALGLGSIAALPGCGTTADRLLEPTAKAPVRSSPLQPQAATAVTARPELTDFIAAAGLEWLLITNPHIVYGLLNRLHVALVSEVRLDAFARHSGLDLRTCTEIAIARYPDSTLYLARAPGSSSTFATRFAARDSQGTGGSAFAAGAAPAESTPQAEYFVELDADVFAVAVGNPRPAKAAKLFAQGRLKRSPPALAGSSLQLLPPNAHQGTLRLYATGPLPGAEQAVLGRVQAGSISLDVTGKQLRGRAYAVGNFIASEDEHLTAFVRRVLESDLANLLGLDSAAGQIRLSHEADAVVVECDWNAERVLNSALYVLEARLSALLGEVPTNDTK